MHATVLQARLDASLAPVLQRSCPTRAAQEFVAGPTHRPHRPEGTVLYGLIRDHLDGFLQRTERLYAKPLPRYVVDAFRAYLRCGVFAYGFVRSRCPSCGHEQAVAFSCKTRGVCPSCAARRMSDGAARLVDRVLPNVPIRQWVLTLPWEIRQLAAQRAEVLRVVVRFFVEAVFRALRRRVGGPGAQCGAVSFVQRFGGSLNLHVHPHVLVLDGVYERDREGHAVFRRAPAPTQDDIAWVARAFGRRLLRWLRRRGWIRRPGTEGEGSNEAVDEAAIEACARLAAAGGSLQSVDGDGVVHRPDAEERRFGARMASRWSATVDGFNVHAGVRVRARDDEARERLCRYAARPGFALDRLSVLRDGRVAYRVKYAPSVGATHRVMTPPEFLARLAALVPPPRYPLTRYHGVLASASRWRPFVVPQPPSGSAERSGDGTDAPSGKCFGQVRNAEAAPAERPGDPAPNVLTAEHWARLRNGRDLAEEGRIDWATLLRRTFAIDVLECPCCGGRMRPLEVVADPAVARALLALLGLEAAPLPEARARDPTGDEGMEMSCGDGSPAASPEVDESQVPQGEFDWAE